MVGLRGVAKVLGWTLPSLIVLALAAPPVVGAVLERVAEPQGLPATSTPMPSSTPTRTPTAMPTATGTPSLSPTLRQTPTAINSATPQPTVTRTPTATPTPPIVGGRAFALQGNHATHLSWADGSLETAYLVVRWSPPSEFAFLPSPINLLGSTATSYTDNGPFPHELYCYLVVPLDGNPPSFDRVLGLSDFLCWYPASHDDPVPEEFTIRLDQSNQASLRWLPPVGGTPHRYELTAIRFDGSPNRTMQLEGNRTSYSEDTKGLTTCYRLAWFVGQIRVGISDTICGAPGIASFSAGMTSDAVVSALARAVGSAGVPARLEGDSR